MKFTSLIMMEKKKKTTISLALQLSVSFPALNVKINAKN